MSSKESKATSVTANQTLLWTDAGTVFDSYMAVTPTHFVAANLVGDALGEARAAVESGADAVAAAGTKATVIPIGAIERVTANLKGTGFDIRFAGEKKRETKTYSSVDRAMRDGLLAALEKALGRDAARSEVEYGRGRAAVSPIIGMVVVTGLGWICFVAARSIAAGEDAEITGSRRAIKRLFVWLMDLLGPTGVAIVFGLLLLLMVYWLVKRVGTPPVMLTLQRP